MSAPAWLSIYRNFDDDALAALASVGLVRRAQKDVEAGKVAWVETHGAIRADGQTVILGQEGPGRASCDCPAPGVCKHILAASIWLRAIDETAGQAADPLAELCALEPAAVFKSAGVAAARKAAALFAAAGPATLTVQGGVLLIEAPELDLSCRFIAGGGFAGMVSETAPASRAATHLLAVALAWKAHGRSFDWPQAAAPAPQAQPGLGEAELHLLARLREVLLEVCAGGWSHVSEVTPAQLRAFAMSARVEAFPRLSGMMRTLAGTAELLARRDAGSDERQAIRLAARVHAMCHALGHAQGEALEALRGRERRSFSGGAELELLPLGAHWWEQRSGARGLAVSFWDHSSGAVVQAVLARRDAIDQMFTRDSAWQTHSLWPGVGAASTLGERTLALQDARVSSDNRIGIGGDTRARSGVAWQAEDPRWDLAGFGDWQALGAAMRAGAGLRASSLEYALLKPAALEAPQLDEAAQLLTWTLRDSHGRALVLRLPCTPGLHTRIANLEAWSAYGMPIRGVLVRLERGQHGGILEPVTLVLEAKRVLRCVSLDYQAPPASLRMAFANRIMRMLRAQEHAARWTPPPSHLQWVEALLVILEHKGMTGRLHVLGEERADLEAIGQYLRASGLDIVAAALRRYMDRPDAAGALTLVHLCQTCIELDTSFIFR